MVYAALTFWLLTAVLIAWGVHRLWCGMARPTVVNAVLLPGTLVAETGRMLGLFITGARVRAASLYDLDDGGTSAEGRNPETRIPVVGPVIVGLLPLIFCGTAIYFVADAFGSHVMARLQARVVGPALPTTLTGIWQFLRDQITLIESIVSALASTDLTDWRTYAFLYLITCLAVRVAPVGGNLRGVFGAILVLGVGGAALGSLLAIGQSRMATAWGILNLTIAMLMALLAVTVLIRGVVGLARVLRVEV